VNRLVSVAQHVRGDEDVQRHHAVDHRAPHGLRKVTHHGERQAVAVRDAPEIDLVVAQRPHDVVDVGCIGGGGVRGSIHALLLHPVAEGLQPAQVGRQFRYRTARRLE
jgi:hypothetical protein